MTSSTTGSGNTAVRDKLYGQRQFAASANGRVVSIPLWHMPTGEGLLPGWEYCTSPLIDTVYCCVRVATNRGVRETPPALCRD